MSDPSREGPAEGEEVASPEAVLRGKYLDYCSARVADILLQLTPDEFFVLARDAARDAGREPEDLPYETMVELVTRRITDRLELPPFETWREAYREDPDRFEADILGLWKSDIGDPSAV